MKNNKKNKLSLKIAYNKSDTTVGFSGTQEKCFGMFLKFNGNSFALRVSRYSVPYGPQSIEK